MAGDWIKVEHTTPDKPEVVAMSARLRIDQDTVAGKLFRLWIWADQNTVSGGAMPITEAFIDRLTRRAGFADALRAVGWLEGADGNLSFPRFSRHNGRTAKDRAETNRRVAAHRKRNGGTVTFPIIGETSEPLQKPLPEDREDGTEIERAPTLEEVRAEFERCGRAGPDAETMVLHFWGKWDSLGWQERGQPLHRWRSRVPGAIATWTSNDAHRGAPMPRPPKNPPTNERGRHGV